MDFSNEELRKLTKEELIKSFFPVSEEEAPLAHIVLAKLPPVQFETVVRAHNVRVNFLLNRCPEKWYEISCQLKDLLIPTFQKFQSILDDPQEKKRIPPEYRQAKKYGVYQSWILRQNPIAEIFRQAFFLRKFPVYVPEKYRKRHVFCVGKSGSGKSETLKLLALTSKMSKEKEKSTGYKLPRKKRSLVIIDPHGDFALEMAKSQMYYADFVKNPDDPDLIYIDPFLAANKKSGYRFPTINPFDIKGKNDFEIEKIAQQLTRVLQTLVCGGDLKLSGNMETLLIPCVTVLLKRPKSTMFDLLRFMGRENFDDLLKLGVKSKNEGQRFFFRNSFLEKRFDATKGALSTKIQSLLNNQAFANFLAKPKSTIDLEHALNTGKSIIVNCSSGKAGAQTMEAIGRFIVGIILSVAFNRAEKENVSRTPIYLIIDEMHNFVSDEIKTILYEARKYALHLTLACQVVGQEMSTQLNKAVLGNSGVFMVGSAGADSQSAMAKEMHCDTELFQNLKVGEFVTKSGEYPAMKLKMSSAYVGTKSQMKPEEWEQLKQGMIELYYRKQQSTSQEEDEDETLKEEIEAAKADPVKERKAKRTYKRAPKYGKKNPFDF